jgi:hypothetical protein
MSLLIKRITMKRVYLFLFASAFTVLTIAISCRKNQDKNDSAEIAQQNTLSQKSMDEIGTMAAQAISGQFTTYAASCDTIIYDTTGTTKTITIDFGTADCLCADGKRRKGKVLVSNNGQFDGIGAANATTITTSNYYVNDNLIEGNRTVTRTSVNLWTIVSNATITLSGELGVITWKGDHVRKYVSGENTPYIADDEYELTGSATGVNTKDVEFTVTVIEPLKVQTGCRWIKGGMLEITSPSIKEEATFDYGDGTCDNTALLKYGKKEKTLTI